jgi:hypothetical protein
MARSEITTAAFIDLTTSSENSAGIIVEDATYTTLVAGTDNGAYWSFADAEFFIMENSTGGSATFTVPLTEPDDYTERGITFNDKTFTVATGKHVIYPVDSRFKDASGNVNIDCSVGGKIAVVKRYTIK